MNFLFNLFFSNFMVEETSEDEMKASLVVMTTLFLSLSAHAAFTSCEYQEKACNEKGDHYFCTLYGWAYGEFCSPTDVTRLPGGRTRNFQCADCYSMPKPSQQCQDQCNCHSAFCGS